MFRFLLFWAFFLSTSCETLQSNRDFIYPELKEKDISGSKESPLRLLGDRPLCVETKVHELDDQVTPNHKMFVRNNGFVPDVAYQKDFSDWSLVLDGEVESPRKFSLDDLKTLFKNYEYQLTLECGGNGRAAYYPKAKGHQWTYGAVSCALWKGVRLKDLLDFVGLKQSAVYLAYESFDSHLSGDASKKVISRGVPLWKALDPMTLVAFELNGAPLPPEHGAPVRLMCPGFPGSASGKWLKRLWVRDKVHDGVKMNGSSYRVPILPLKPGADLEEDTEMAIIEKMPVKSIITYPKSGLTFRDEAKDSFQVRGFAWTGEESVSSVHVSYDYGATWHKASLEKPRNKFSWQRWRISLSFPSKGYFKIWARATDSTGKSQPMLVPAWNPKGYLNNAMPLIDLTFN